MLRVQKLTIAGAKERLKLNKDSACKKEKNTRKLMAIRKELVIRHELNQNEAVDQVVQFHKISLSRDQIWSIIATCICLFQSKCLAQRKLKM